MNKEAAYPRNNFTAALVIAGILAFANQPLFAEAAWFVQEGKAVDIVDAGDVWSEGSDGLTASGSRSRLDAGKCVGSGDFNIIAVLKLDDIKKDNASFMIDAGKGLDVSELIFARNGRVVVRGFFFGDRTQTARKLNGLISSKKWFKLNIKRKDGVVFFLVEGELVWKMRYENSRPFGKVSLKPGRAEMTVRHFGMRGNTYPLDEWTPRLERDYSVAGKYSTDVFVSGEGGYHTYRIPAVVRSIEGTLLAFAEGRKDSHHDHGDVDIVLRRSVDNGKSWKQMKLVYEEGDTAKITIGNPSPVVDRETGRIWLFFCRDNKEVFSTYSDDDGLSFSEPVNLTGSLKKENWGSWYATGPCHGIQLESGRLVIPANHSEPEGGRVHMIVSDNHGQSWQIADVLDPGTNENSVAELQDGRIFVSIRRADHNNKKQYCRKVAWSKDEGDNFSSAELVSSLVGPICQAAVLSFDYQNNESVLLHSNPKSQRRERMTVRASNDGGKSWNEGLRVYEGSSAYSDMVQVNPNTVGLLFERDLYGSITFTSLDIEEIVR
ncbi:sialidase family protein [Sedimentisphaera salicampi]|uniref:exo-alpha-sialidase n=1 Tax=Sedimentisphaera salicampi TaxID=1941349 RepID=A0A1W6LKB4_9BACT|nr:sialidase family protein [Sedimentisphaera salicampi]ARN56174.1 Sialidase precursor [Sedimentisphaera salicampi]